MIDGTPNEDETAIIVAVGRGKAPGAASALDREWQEHTALGNHTIQHRVDAGDLLAIHLGRDVSQVHARAPTFRYAFIVAAFDAVHRTRRQPLCTPMTRPLP